MRRAARSARDLGGDSAFARTAVRLRVATRRIPRAARICALAGVLNAATWSLITPPFQIPDEPAQYAYAEHVAQTGQPPAERSSNPFRLDLSPDEQVALRDLRSNDIGGIPANAGLWSQLEQQRLLHDLHARASRQSDGYSYGATPQPPLYYALEAIPYRIGAGATLLQRLALMRLLSALLGGVTVLFVFLFLREALPGASWTWTVGALGVAFQPMFAFITSGMNPDALLFAASAALFLCVARAFRHGLTRRLAVATGTVVAVGLLGKLNFLGLLPGAAVAIVAASVRQERASRSSREPGARTRLATLRLPALALTVAALPILLEMALNVGVWDRPAIGLLSSNGGALSHGTLGHRLSYLWQVYLPRLPGMKGIFSYGTTRSYFDEFTGAFGGLDTRFPASVTDRALVVAALVVGLGVRALVGARGTLRRRLPELLSYAAMVGGMLVVIAAQYYALDLLAGTSGGFTQVRYLLPLVPLYGALLVLAARGTGARLAPLAGTLIVVLALAHDVFSQLLAIGRFYA